MSEDEQNVDDSACRQSPAIVVIDYGSDDEAGMSPAALLAWAQRPRADDEGAAS